MIKIEKIQENKEKKVSEKKQKLVSELSDLIKKSKTIMVVSIENLPSNQFQKIKRCIKEKATIKVIKKNLIKKSIEKNDKLKELEKYFEKNFAILFSELDPFDLASLLQEYKLNTKIRAGQIVEKDIILEVGPTDIMAGPAISEFTKAGIKVGIEQGKIAIKEPFIIKSGTMISQDIAGILEKLEIKPLSVGLKPIIAYDSKNNKIYKNINIDKEETINLLISCSKKAYTLALAIKYICKETIINFLNEANLIAKSLDQIINQKNKEE